MNENPISKEKILARAKRNKYGVPRFADLRFGLNMFTLKKNVVESDKGFSVQVLGRAGIKYVEGSKSMVVDSELLIGPYYMVIYKKSIMNWKENSEHIDQNKKDEMVQNIREAFLFLGLEITIEEDYWAGTNKDE